MQLTDQDAEIDPVPTDGGGHKANAELDRLSNIIRSFNDLFGNITWLNADRIRQLIATEIPNKVAANSAYQNAKQNSDKQNARIEHDKALGNVIIGLMKDDTELFAQFSDNPEFKRWLADTIFTAMYDRLSRLNEGSGSWRVAIRDCGGVATSALWHSSDGLRRLEVDVYQTGSSSHLWSQEVDRAGAFDSAEIEASVRATPTNSSVRHKGHSLCDAATSSDPFS